MFTPWSRRSLLTLACAAATLLSACGSGSIESALKPARFVAFGTGMSDLGEGGSRYTVNDATTSIWTQQLAQRYGLTLTTAATGGLSFARGNARVSAKPDAAGNAATPTVVEQVDRFLASNTFGATDVVLMEAGVSDVIAEVAAFRSGAQTQQQMLDKLDAAGRALGEQVRRLVGAGARYVVVVGSYNLGRSPWARSINQATLVETATLSFNNGMLVTVNDLGANVLYIDAALHYNLVIAAPGIYGGMTDSTNPSCTSVDAGAGIGIGTGQVSSALCTPATIAAGVDYTKRVFADAVYPSPTAQRSFGDYAFDRLRLRW
ncbi:MAG: SGNH/GDSL hydrolase family protein [Burkholderiaceae bacterium]